MASIALTEPSNGISIGNVFGRSIDVIKSNPVATLGITFLLIALPQLLAGLLGKQYETATLMQGGQYLAVAGVFVVYAALWLIASGALVQATVAHSHGYKASLTEMVRIGILRCLPLAAVYFFLMLALWVGMILLIVPGIILAVVWAVATPAVVAEKTGVFGAFSRSAALTRGARWHIFGILLLAFVIYMLVLLAVNVLTVAGSGSFAAIASGAASADISPVGRVVQALVTTVILAWMNTIYGALFVELRRWKDGPDTDQLSDIFA